MTPWKGLILFFIVASLLAGGRTQCTKETIANCLRHLLVDGVGVSDGGAIGLLTTATSSSIESACTSRFPVSKQCLRDVVASCAADNILKSEANGAVSYLTYLCSEQGLSGITYLHCLERQEVQQAVQNCSAPFEKMLRGFQNTSSVGDVFKHIFGGQFLKDFCGVVTSARWCTAITVAKYCSVEASMYNDGLFQQLAQRVSSFLKCPDYEFQFECPSNPCMNSGTCFGVPPDYTSCTCVTGYTGDRCQHAPRAAGCVSSRCENGGWCSQDSDKCICPTDYTGTLCQNLDGTTDGQTKSGGTAFSQTEAFITAIVCVIVLLGVILIVLYCIRAKRKNRLVETVQEAVHPKKDPGHKIPPDF